MPDLPHRLRLNGGNVSEKRFVLLARGSIIFMIKIWNYLILRFKFYIMLYPLEVIQL